MSTIGDRLEMGLTALSLSGAELARRAGLPNRHMVSRLKSGDRPAAQHLDAIARVLGTTREWLVNGTGMPPTWAPADATEDRLFRPSGRNFLRENKQNTYSTDLSPSDRDVLYPVVGRAAAASGVHVDGVTDEEPPVRIRERWRAVKIHGDSGYPVVLDGQTVLVDPALPCERNRIVVVHTDDGPQLKRIGDQLEDGRVMLASLNAGRDPKLVRFSDYARQPEVVVAVVFTDSVAR